MKRRQFIGVALCTVASGFVADSLRPFAIGRAVQQKAHPDSSEVGRITKSDAEWKRILTPEQYHITREKGTEAPYSSPLLKVHERGKFECVCCSLPLFSSKTKFESNTGWPSFWAPISKTHVKEEVDRSLEEVRTEVMCARCDSHVGHVFQDGPPPTGLRYCMNGVALKFAKGAA